MLKNHGVERNKKPLQNIIYKVEISQLKEDAAPETIERFKQYMFKDMGYLILHWNHQKTYNQHGFMNWHGPITPDELKERLVRNSGLSFAMAKESLLYNVARMARIKKRSPKFPFLIPFYLYCTMKTEFATKVREVLIPSIEKMIEKEEAHLKLMQQHHADMLASKSGVAIEGILITQFIQTSEQFLAHLKQRLEEYQKFLIPFF